MNGIKNQTSRLSDYAGIFLLAMGLLLYEVTLTRIFSFVIWSNYAFMIVSTALFGMGLAGVFMSLAGQRRFHMGRDQVPLFSLLFGVLAIVSLVLIIEVPLVVGEFGKLKNWLYLGVIYLALIAPFFCAGVTFTILLSGEGKQVHRLYFFDLIGAALGSILLVLVISPLGASGAVLLAAFLGIAAAAVFAHHGGKWRLALIAATIICAVATPFGEQLLPIKPHQSKRWFQAGMNATMFSAWSSLSRVDVTGRLVDGKVEPYDIWINGGENESMLARYSRTAKQEPAWDSINFPYIYLSAGGRQPKVAIIGSSGGIEVTYALSHDAGHVDAIEMDPVICAVVKDHYKSINDGMFSLPQVNLANDEGRSYIVNSNKRYDLIQMRNNFTPIAFASGAINLSETYLLTVEAFEDYFAHLTDDGILALNRWGTARMCTIIRALGKRLGIKDIDRHVMIVAGEAWMVNGVYLRKRPYTDEEIAAAYRWEKDRGFKVLYAPDMAKDANLYAKILKSDDPRQYYRAGGYELSPPTDNWPFFDHFLYLGRPVDVTSEDLPTDMKKMGLVLRWLPHSLVQKVFGGDPGIPKSDLPMVAITVEIVLISLLLIVLPLVLLGRREASPLRKAPFLAYFSILGAAFIMIELCFIKQFILFLGNPAFSISLVIAALLVFSGIGSFISERFGERPVKALGVVFPLIFALNVAMVFLLPVAFDLFLGSSLAVRIIVSVLVLAPIGTVMGMPFPLGLRLVHNASATMVGWAWGVNGFMTVVGSILTVIISLYLGFQAVLWTAGLLYLCGLWAARGMSAPVK